MKWVRYVVMGIAVAVALFAGFVWLQFHQTERHIAQFREKIVDIADAVPPELDLQSVLDLPEPVRRYFDYVFVGPVEPHRVVRLEAEGEFRLPLGESFSATTAEQVIAIGTPALMFSATTPVAPGIWARAYDYFAEGRMEMKAKVLSTVTVVDERETPELNRISIRRWLLESALYPQALLPGGLVSWEAIDEESARAIVKADGLEASLVFHFNQQGQVTHLMAEQDGDLTTPYHGSGEHVTREDYRQVGNMMIPHRFTISRAAGGKLYPFFKANLTKISFE